MKLPNANAAVVDREKIVDYLLNPAHPDNGGKARFFRDLGFRLDQWESLAAALRTLAVESDVTDSRKSPYGEKFVLVGNIQSPYGESCVQSIWIVDNGRNHARLVTAYPRKA